ncbi:hypothetical protein [Burkholderia territorii]|uniref:hypothetical protein n=1 Tax=Burkholderia territorii TaxID=1503055 RepID=UPI001E50BB53|nr:hypothetical protein [Burkholderia territorii]
MRELDSLCRKTINSLYREPGRRLLCAMYCDFRCSCTGFIRHAVARKHLRGPRQRNCEQESMLEGGDVFAMFKTGGNYIMQDSLGANHLFNAVI